MERFEHWVQELGAVLAAPDSPRLKREPLLDKKWKAGDIAAEIPLDHLDQVAEALDIAPGVLRSYAKVAREIPPEERTARAAWSVYREIAGLPREERGILRDGLTLRQVRREIGKKDMDQKATDRQDIDDRVRRVIEELQEPKVRDLVMAAMEMSVADRRAKKAARTTVDEMAARAKFAEEELRRQKKQPTPDRKFWECSKELAEACRLIYSMAKLHEEHREVMNDSRWDEIVKTLRDVSQSAKDVADSIEGVGDGDFLEAEAVDEYLALGSGNDITDAEILGEEELR